jgi:hypothetical protein
MGGFLAAPTPDAELVGLATDTGEAIKTTGVAIVLALAPLAVGLFLARRAVSWAFGMVG